MLNSRLASPQQIIKSGHRNSKSTHNLKQTNRTKSISSFKGVINKMEQVKKTLEMKSIKRVSSAVKMGYRRDTQLGDSQTMLPKVGAQHNQNLKGKLHLGKIIKPKLIMGNQERNNPWGAPKPISQNLITQKGLMQMVNMGILPKTANLADILNHKYEIPIQQPVQQFIDENNSGFFATNPQIEEINQHQINQPINGPIDKEENTQQNEKKEKKLKKKSKKVHTKKKQNKQDFWKGIFQHKVILKISHQKIEQNQQYIECLKNMRDQGNQMAFKYYVRSMENFAKKYQLKKFEFNLLIDETRKMSDNLLYNQILNRKVLGINLAVKGTYLERGQNVGKMFVIRFKYKKMRKQLLKIENIKRFYRIQKYYEEMAGKRLSLLQYKYGSFAENQRRYLQQILQSGQSNHNPNFRFQFHIPLIADTCRQNQQTYYKLNCRNNIQLTRLFKRNPEYVILLTNQSHYDITPWTKIIKKIPGYHPIIEVLHCAMKFGKTRAIDELYYGINRQTKDTIRRICEKSENSAIFTSNYSNTIVKICESLNIKLFGGSLWKPQLDQILKSQQQVEASAEQEEDNKISVVSTYKKQKEKEHQPRYLQRIQKIKANMKKLSSYFIANQYFANNKLNTKIDIFYKYQCRTPYTLILQPFSSNSATKLQENEGKFLHQLAELIFAYKNYNKWVFKISTMGRFSRGLAFLETDALKILKDKKKKPEITAQDIQQIRSILKLILLDKLELSQNDLYSDRLEYYNRLIQYGGYVEPCINDSKSACVFGYISPFGKFVLQGTYTKIYTDLMVNCCAFYPSVQIPKEAISNISQVAKNIYKDYQIFGHVTFELLIESARKNYYFIDFYPSLEQYSSLYPMYSTILNVQNTSAYDKMSVIKGYHQSKELNKSTSAQYDKKGQQTLGIPSLKKRIVYCPFVDNNGNIFSSFQEFEETCDNKRLTMNYDEQQGLQFLYLNLEQQLPDVLSMVSMAKTLNKALKYILDGLAMLMETSGDRINKFDKKIQRKPYDCLCISDLVWKLREIKKALDNSVKN